VKNTFRNIIGTGLMTILLVVCGHTATAQTVVFLATDTLTASKRAASGARSAIKEVHETVVFYDLQLSLDSPDLQTQLDQARTLKPDIIVTIGSTATQLARDNFPQTPIIFSAVKYPVLSGFVESVDRPGGHITGASLDIPVDIQFRYFKQIIPNLKRIGVLYTSNTARLIPPARVVASQMGMELAAIEVTGPRDLPRALDSLAGCAQGLWSVADPNLFDPQSTKFILLNSLRQGLPFMGFSRYVVESGALFALDFDYKAIGRQAGQIAAKVLKGANPGQIPVSAPDIIWFHYNENTARHAKIEIPSEVVAIAKEVYR
jgi:putative ABC transport system substrate-binding protein